MNKSLVNIFSAYVFLFVLSVNSQELIPGLDQDFLDSLPDDIKNDVVNEIKNSNKEEKKQFNNIPSVALDKSETLRKWNRFLQENEKLDNKSEVFGIDFFKEFQSTFSPTNVPNYDGEYIVDYGDIFQLQIIGQINVDSEVEVLRDGTIMIPYVGNVSVAGLSINKVDELVRAQVTQKYVGSAVYISLKEIRDIQVSLTGRAFSPGIYTLSGNSNLIHLLNVAGGILETGSFREIHIKRNGKVVKKVDMYDFFIGGNTQLANQLRSGDSVVILPSKSMVRISGGVERPSMYELNDTENLYDLLRFAQGFTDFADDENMILEKVENKSIVSSNISSNSLMNIRASHGMSLYVEEFKLKQVTVTGAVKNPGIYSITDGEMLSDIIKRSGGYNSDAYPLGGVLLNEKARQIQEQNNQNIYSNIIKSFAQSLTSIASRSSGNNEGTSAVIAMLLQNIKDQKPNGRIIAEFDLLNINDDPQKDTLLSHKDTIHIPRISQQVHVYGEVGMPGSVRYASKNSIEDYLESRGGLLENASSDIIIVAPNGMASTYKHSSGLLSRLSGSDNNIIMPGSVIYIPNDISNVSGLPALSVIAPIFSSFALTLASLSSLND